MNRDPNYMLTRIERAIVRAAVLANFEGRNPARVHFHADHSVSVWLDPMPGTNQSGRIFAGWDDELLQEASA